MKSGSFKTCFKLVFAYGFFLYFLTEERLSDKDRVYKILGLRLSFRYGMNTQGFLLRQRFTSLAQLSIGIITIQQMAWFVLLSLIHWILIYPVDNVIHLSNKWDVVFNGARISINSNKQTQQDVHNQRLSFEQFPNKGRS